MRDLPLGLSLGEEGQEPGARSREPGPGLAEAETAGHRLVVLAGVGKTRLGAAARNADHRSLARALYVVHLAALLHLRPLNPHTPCP